MEELLEACKGKNVDEIEAALKACNHAGAVLDPRAMAAYLKKTSG